MMILIEHCINLWKFLIIIIILNVVCNSFLLANVLYTSLYSRIVCVIAGIAAYSRSRLLSDILICRLWSIPVNRSSLPCYPKRSNQIQTPYFF